MSTQQADPIWMVTEDIGAVSPRRRIRGLRVSAVPSWPLVAQLGGGAAALAGVYQQFGSGYTLIVGGVVAGILGALREAGRI